MLFPKGIFRWDTNCCFYLAFNGVFHLTETDIDTKREADKMAKVLNGISLSVQYKNLHTTL